MPLFPAYVNEVTDITVETSLANVISSAEPGTEVQSSSSASNIRDAALEEVLAHLSSSSDDELSTDKVSVTKCDNRRSSEKHKKLKKKSKKKSVKHKKSKKRSRSRSHSRSDKKFRENKYKTSHSRSREYSRSRSRSPYYRRRRRSRSESRDARNKKRCRSRSRSPRRHQSLPDASYHSKRKSDRRSRSHERSPSNKRSHSHERSPVSEVKEELKSASITLNASKTKGVFVENIGCYIRLEYVMYRDECGDKNNLTFDATHYTQLARYPSFKDALGKTNEKKPPKKPVRYFHRGKKRVLLQNSLLTTPINELNTPSSAVEYVPVNLTYSEAVRVNAHRQQQFRENIDDSSYYLDKVQLDEESSNYTEGTEYEYWMKLSKSYNERLSKDPKNEQLWLEFVRFQDKASIYLFAIDENNGPTSKKGEINKSNKALVERKISLLDTAIKKNPNSIVLQCEKLSLGQHVWDHETTNKQWSTLIYNFPNNMEVWHRYLRHYFTCFSQYRVSTAISAAARCCHKIRSMATGVFVTHRPPLYPSFAYIDIIALVCRMWCQTGYRERSVALWQGLLEFNVNTPPALHQLTNAEQDESVLPYIEQFWDSRAPRIGEVDNIGWYEALNCKQTMAYREQILEGHFDEEDAIVEAALKSHPILKTFTENDSDASDTEENVLTPEEREAQRQRKIEYESRLCELWLNIERLREQKHWLPYSQDPEYCEDPDRIVTFDVISPFITRLPFVGSDMKETLPSVPHHTEECVHFYLALRFIESLGIDVSEVESLFFESLNISDYDFRCLEDLKLETFESLFPEALQELCQEYHSVVEFVPAVGPSAYSDNCESYFEFINSVISSVMKGFTGENYHSYLAIISIKILTQRFKSKHQRRKNKSEDSSKLRKKYKKLCKKLLSSDKIRNNLLVFKEYGCLEEAFGNFVEAENIYLTALLIGTSDKDLFSSSSEVFIRISKVTLAFIKLHLKAASGSSQEDASLHLNSIASLICCLANNGNISSTDLPLYQSSSALRAKVKLAELLKLTLESILLSYSIPNRRMLRTVCCYLALLQHITIGSKAFCLVYEDLISKVQCATASVPPSNSNEVEASGPQQHVNNKDFTSLLRDLHEDYISLGTLLDQCTAGLPLLSLAQKRDTIQRALQYDPDSLVLLAAFSQVQSWRDLFCGAGMQSTLRQFLFRLLPHLSAASRLPLSAENNAALSTGHTVVSVLRHAVETNAGLHCPLLWRLLLHWCKLTGRGARAPVSSALTSCPGNKSVYMGALSDVEGTSVKNIVRLMEERGLHCRLPLQELMLLLQDENDEA